MYNLAQAVRTLIFLYTQTYIFGINGDKHLTVSLYFCRTTIEIVLKNQQWSLTNHKKKRL